MTVLGAKIIDFGDQPCQGCGEPISMSTLQDLVVVTAPDPTKPGSEETFVGFRHKGCA